MAISSRRHTLIPAGCDGLWEGALVSRGNSTTFTVDGGSPFAELDLVAGQSVVASFTLDRLGSGSVSIADTGALESRSEALVLRHSGAPVLKSPCPGTRPSGSTGAST